MGRLKVIILDTCALLWRAFNPNSLSLKALQAIEKSEKILISSISFWEIGIKIKNKKLEIPIPLEEFAQQTRNVKGIEIVPVDEMLWIKSLSLSWDHRDPADRVIVALAQINHSPLVTIDRTIVAFYKKSVW